MTTRPIWREGGVSGPAAPSSPRRRIFSLLALIVGLGSAVVGLIALQRAPARTAFVPLWVTSYRDPHLSAPPFAAADRAALAESDLFAHTTNGATVDLAHLVRELTALQTRRSGERVVVYLGGLARTDAAGQVQLLPADADRANPTTWLPLRRALELIHQCPARHKLVLIDVAWPLADAMRGTLSNDVAAAVMSDLAAVEDSGRLALCSCAPGQVPHASPALGRSVFGHYLEQGLRGAAARNGDVTARGLADYVRGRVDRWARTTRQVRQTPVLVGTARDFALVTIGREPQPAEPGEAPSEKAHPEWLTKAWQKAPPLGKGGPAQEWLARQTADLLLTADRTWREGEAPEKAETDYRTRLTALRAKVPAPPAAPKAFTLALEPGADEDRARRDEVQRLLFRVEGRTRNLPADKASETRALLAKEFLKTVEGQPHVDLARAVVDAAIATPVLRPETIRFLDDLLRPGEQEPRYVETLMLRRLIELEGSIDTETARRALAVARQGEQAAARPRAFPWLRDLLEQAAQKRHEGEILLEAAGYAPARAVGPWLQAAATGYEVARAYGDTTEAALGALAEARAVLPFYLRYLERTQSTDSTWLAAARLASELAERLEAARKPGALAGQVGDIRLGASALRARLRELERPFGAEGLAELLQDGRRANPSPAVGRELRALLLTPLLSAANRVAVWRASGELERRLQDQVDRLDRQGAPEESPFEEKRALEVERQRAAQRGRWASAALRLEGAAGSQAPPAAVAEGAALWGWLADRYRYEAREHPLGVARAMTAKFYTEASLAYRPWAALEGPYAEMSESSNPPLLRLDQPITQSLEVRIVAPGAVPPTRIDALISPADEWLRVTPASFTLPRPGVPLTSEQPVRQPLRIELKPGGPERRTPAPLGFLVRAELAGRSFHYKLTVPLVSVGPDVLVSATPKGPALGRVRLRAVAGTQSYYVQLKNPTGRTWRRLTAELLAGDKVEGVTAPVALAPGDVVPLLFKAPPLLAPAPKTEAPAAPPAPPGAVAAFPLLSGPLRVRIRDLDSKNEVVVTRTIDVGVAQPSEYVEVTGARFQPATAAGKNRLEVRLRAREALRAPPCLTELTFPPAAEGGPRVVLRGALRGVLPVNAAERLLYAENLQWGEATEGRSTFAVRVDDWPRGFVFQSDFPRAGGAVLPRRIAGTGVRARTGTYALAGPDYVVPVEVDDPPAGATLEVSLGHLEGGAFTADSTQKLPFAWEQRIGLNPLGPEGALQFDALVREAAVKFDATGLRGERQVRAVLFAPSGQVLEQDRRPVIFGKSPPAGVRLVNVPAKAWREAPLPLRELGRDPITGIKEVFFFVGKPVAEKVPPGTATTPGAPVDADRIAWAAKLPLPADRKGPIDVSVQFVNGLGLSSFATTTVELTEKDPNTATTGTIKGTVMEGPRPQVGLVVVLSDEKGAVKARTKTAEGGAYEFAGLAPGKYRVSCTKTSNGRSRAFPEARRTFIELKAGATETADLSLAL